MERAATDQALRAFQAALDGLLAVHGQRFSERSRVTIDRHGDLTAWCDLARGPCGSERRESSTAAD